MSYCLGLVDYPSCFVGEKLKGNPKREKKKKEKKKPPLILLILSAVGQYVYLDSKSFETIAWNWIAAKRLEPKGHLYLKHEMYQTWKAKKPQKELSFSTGVF